jgi:hypothetical protein
MTFERKIVIGLEEIKAVIFQCNKCGSKISIAPDKLDSIPRQCPNDHAFLWNPSPEFAGSMLGAFTTSIKKLREPIYENLGFKIFLELEEPKPPA